MVQHSRARIGKYGHILHLPGSRMGPGDHRADPALAALCTERILSRHDRIIVEEELDGSNVAVARLDGSIVPVTRSGEPAGASRHLQHRLFDAGAGGRFDDFLAVLREGERLCGEWLAQAHGTRYELRHDPFVAFDIIAGVTRLGREAFRARVSERFVTPFVLHEGGPLSTDSAEAKLQAAQGLSPHGAIDPIEGAVWRVESGGQFESLAKWVRPDKIDGKYLPRQPGDRPIWNWQPRRTDLPRDSDSPSGGHEDRRFHPDRPEDM